MKVSGILCAILAVSAITSAASDEPHKTSTGAGAAVLTYIVSLHSPLLSKAERIAVSQDFNGAPLAGKPAIHNVTAKSVGCRARNPNLGKASPRCTIDFGEATPVDFRGSDASRLFDALGKLGAEDEPGMGHIRRQVSNLSCTVDDAKAQETPATGDNVAGFACSFAAGQ